MHTAACATCRAIWSEGHFTDACQECGGGAMERPCYICDGRCGAVMLRAVSDSNEIAVGDEVRLAHERA
jgi:hypothetical protein